MTTQRYAATFTPQAWVRDNAVDVDPEGDIESFTARVPVELAELKHWSHHYETFEDLLREKVYEACEAGGVEGIDTGQVEDHEIAVADGTLTAIAGVNRMEFTVTFRIDR